MVDLIARVMYNIHKDTIYNTILIVIFQVLFEIFFIFIVIFQEEFYGGSGNL